MFAHAKDPNRPINWLFWTQHEAVTAMLRTLLLSAPDILLQMGYRSAVGTIRMGTVVWHWDVEYDYLIKCMLHAMPVEKTQQLALAPLSQSPILLEVSKPAEIDFNPDMIVVIAVCKIDPETTDLLDESWYEKRINVYFQLDYNHEHARALDPTAQTMKIVRLGRLGHLERCHNCRVSLEGTKVVKCNQCNVSVYCSAACKKTHWVPSHKHTCAKLADLCKSRFSNCFMKEV